MGIGRAQARLLLDEASQRPYSGRALQLGRQHFFFTVKEFECWSKDHGVRLQNDFVDRNRREPLLDPESIDDGSFFALLGFDTVESCDFSPDENPTFTVDLNICQTDQNIGQYDTIFDIGTLEHVFHVPNVLMNIHSLMKVGGRIIHQIPSSNHVDHGFYMFSPTLLADYYMANNYEICSALLFEYTNRQQDLCSIYRYHPLLIHHMSMGGFDRGTMLAIHFVARKTERSTSHVIPQQSYYERQWGIATNQNGSTANNPVIPDYMKEPVARKDRSFLARLKRNLLRKGRRPIDRLKIGEY